jgi:hypothetical protein
MNDSQRRKINKIDREEVFFSENAADFAGNLQVEKYTPLIAAEKAKILAFDAQQTSGFDDKRQAQAIYDARRDELIELLDLFVMAADIVADDIEGTAQKFRRPYPRTDQNLIAKATSFQTDATAIKNELVTAGLPSDAIGRLLPLKDAFQQAALAHNSAEEHHAEATGGMAEAFRKMMEYSSKRGKNVKLKYVNNAAKFAGWTTASHLDRPPRRARKAGDSRGNPG